MRRIGALLCIALLGLFLTSCATVVVYVSEGDLKQKLGITSDPSGAQVFFVDSSTPLGETPLLDIRVKRRANTVLLIKKEGYEDKYLTLTHRHNPWFWGNIICCGLIGSTTDDHNHTDMQFSPTEYHVILNPKKASFEQREQFARITTARYLTLRGYLEVQQNLAVGHGEYLASLLTTLRVPESEQGNATRQLQKLMVDSIGPLDFSDKVLDSFHLSRR